jgi:hypothetical protein
MKRDEETRSSANDEVREDILNFLYGIYKKARSRESARVSRRELKEGLKQLGLKEQDIVSNLDYLIQSGWVRVETETFEFKTPKGFMRKQVKEYYKISDIGINYFEGHSKFQRLERSIAGINITNIQGITVVGDQNVVVNAQFLDLYRSLSLLSEVVRKSGHLSDEDKLNFTKDIDTIKDQLSKTLPDKTIVKLAWENLKPLATVSGIVSFFQKVAELIGLIL